MPCTSRRLLLFTEQSGHGLDPRTALRPRCSSGSWTCRWTGSPRHPAARSGPGCVTWAGQPTRTCARFRSYGRREHSEAPYTDREVARLLTAAQTLGSALFARRAEAAILLGVGCGLIAYDFTRMSGRDACRAADGAVVAVVPGDAPRGRSVPCLDRYADPLLAVMERTGDDAVCGTLTMKGRRNVTHKIATMLAGADAPYLSVSRLRTAWIVEHLRRNTPLDALMRAAGVTTMGFVNNVLEHVPATDDDTARSALRGRP